MGLGATLPDGFGCGIDKKTSTPREVFGPELSVLPPPDYVVVDIMSPWMAHGHVEAAKGSEDLTPYKFASSFAAQYLVRLRGGWRGTLVLLADVHKYMPVTKIRTQRERGRASDRAEEKKWAKVLEQDPAAVRPTPIRYTKDTVVEPDGVVVAPGEEKRALDPSAMMACRTVRGAVINLLVSVCRAAAANGKDLGWHEDARIVLDLDGGPPLVLGAGGVHRHLEGFNYKVGEGDLRAVAWLLVAEEVVAELHPDRRTPTPDGTPFTRVVESVDSDTVFLTLYHCFENPPATGSLLLVRGGKHKTMDGGALIRHLKKWGWSRNALMAFALFGGNDFMPKRWWANRVGTKQLCERVREAFRQDSRKSVLRLDHLLDAAGALYDDPNPSKRRRVVPKTPPVPRFHERPGDMGPVWGISYDVEGWSIVDRQKLREYCTGDREPRKADMVRVLLYTVWYFHTLQGFTTKVLGTK